MSDGKHTSPGDRSFAASLTRHVASAVALVAAVALVFWLLGRVGPDPGNPVITAPDPTGAATGAPPATSPPPATQAAPSDPPASEPTTSDPTTSEPATPTDTGSPSPSPSEEATNAPDPGSISVQILDAADDDGSAAEEAAAALREAGYQVIATNQAVRTYESSTLFYTDGHEADAEAIADDFSQFDVVEPKPGNLSDAVDVHVVVGADWFAPGD